jgi:hypothetical protein
MKIRFVAVIALQMSLCLSLQAQLIHEDFFGQNAWYINVNGAASELHPYWVEIANSGARTVRIGGIEANRGILMNCNTPSCALIDLIDKIQVEGMKPMIQVSFDPKRTEVGHPNPRSLVQQAQDAADLVTYINITNARGIEYWIIANEPDGPIPDGFGYDANHPNAADLIEDYIREFSVRMKAADSSIKIIGPELTTHYPSFPVSTALTSGVTHPGPNATNIIPYVDIFSFHTYPFGDQRVPPTGDMIPPDRQNVISALTQLTAAANNILISPLKANLSDLRAKLNANGGGSLGIAVTEANLSRFNDVNTTANPTGTNPTPGSDDLPTGNGANSFIAGQFLAEMMFIGMEQEVTLFNFWSALEGAPPDFESDIGYLNSNPSKPGNVGNKKPTYHHYEMVAKNFAPPPGDNSTLYTNATPSTSAKAYAYKNSSEIGVLILNQAKTSTNPWHLDDDFAINLDGTAGSAAIRISLATGVAGSYHCRIKTETSALIKFDLNGNFKSRIEYSIDDAVNNLPPKTWGKSNAYIADGSLWGSTDTGIEPYYGNAWDLPFSHDIWARNWNNGYTDSASGGNFNGNIAHESPDWTSDPTKTPRFFVRLNIPCGPPVSGTIELYQMVSTTADIYLTNWKMIGTPATVTNTIPGQPYVVQFNWTNMAADIPAPPIAGQDYCLVARFVSNDDPMFWERIHPAPGATAGNNIKFNNNIAQRNIQIVDSLNNNFVLSVGNASSLPAVVSFDFVTPTYPPSGPPFTDVGTVNIDLGRTLYDRWVRGGSVGRNVRVARRKKRLDCSAGLCGIVRKRQPDRGESPYSIDITGPDASIGNISLGPEEIHKVDVAFHYTAPNPTDATYSVDIRQFSERGFSGAVRYLITPSDCRAVDAGSDVTIGRNCPATLSVFPLIRDSVYTWHDPATGAVVGTGPSIRVSPRRTTTYQVQMKSPDGCTTTDTVTVTVDPTRICRVVAREWGHIAVVGSFETDRYTKIVFPEGLAEWEFDTMIMGAEYRPLHLTLAAGVLDPSIRVGVGRGNAVLAIGDHRQFDSHVTVVTGGVALHWTNRLRWSGDLEIGYRKSLDSGTTTPATAGGPRENTVDFSALDTTLSARYGVIPECLTVSAGVRMTRGDLTLEQEAEPFLLRNSASIDREQFIAGAEVRFTRRLSANIEVGRRYSAASLRYGIGRGQSPTSTR